MAIMYDKKTGKSVGVNDKYLKEYEAKGYSTTKPTSTRNNTAQYDAKSNQTKYYDSDGKLYKSDRGDTSASFPAKNSNSKSTSNKSSGNPLSDLLNFNKDIVSKVAQAATQQNPNGAQATSDILAAIKDRVAKAASSTKAVATKSSAPPEGAISIYMTRPDGTLINTSASSYEKFLAKGYKYDGVRSDGSGLYDRNGNLLQARQYNTSSNEDDGGDNSQNISRSTSGTSTSGSSKTNSDIMNMIVDMANSTYDQQKNNLRKQVASVLANYNSQLGQVEQNYLGNYQNVDQANYQQQESTKAAMAKAGLLGTGVGQGYDQQNAFKFAGQRQAVDLQKQGQYDTLNKSIADAQRDQEYDLNNIDLEKNNFINTQQLQEAKDLRQIELDNYWKNREMNLAEQQFDFTKDSFEKSYSLQERQQIFAEQSWEKTYQMDRDQFKAQQDQFAKSWGLENDQFAESKRQFDQTLIQRNEQFDKEMGWNMTQLDAQMKQQEAQLKASMANAQLDYRASMARLQQEMKEYENELGKAADAEDLEESKRIDELIAYGLLNDLGADYMRGAIKSSTLSPGMQTKKMEMLNNAFGSGYASVNNSGSTGWSNQNR